MSPAIRLLLVEDDISVGRMLEAGLSAENYTVVWARSLREAAAAVRAQTPDIIVLDRMLPDGDGATFAKLLRTDLRYDAPICMLTARDGLEDKAAGFDAGADDYIVKPFEFEELLMRLTALLRRFQRPKTGLRLDPETRAAAVGTMRTSLTPREWALLNVLAAHAGRTVSRETLIETAWGDDTAVTLNAVDVYMGYVRKKLATLPGAPKIETVRGAGFRLTDP